MPCTRAVRVQTSLLGIPSYSISLLTDPHLCVVVATGTIHDWPLQHFSRVVQRPGPVLQRSAPPGNQADFNAATDGKCKETIHMLMVLVGATNYDRALHGVDREKELHEQGEKGCEQESNFASSHQSRDSC